MAELLDCPECRKQVRVPDELMGKQVRCPSCGATFRAGESASSAGRREAPLREPDPYEEDHRVDEYDDRPQRRRRRYRDDLAPHRGGMILAFGIIGFFFMGIIFGPMAWIMGNNDLREMREGRMDPEGEGQTQAGRICGMIVTILICVAFLCICGIFGMAMVGGAARGVR